MSIGRVFDELFLPLILARRTGRPSWQRMAAETRLSALKRRTADTSANAADTATKSWRYEEVPLIEACL